MNWIDIFGKYNEFSYKLKDIWYRMDSRYPGVSSVRDYLIRNKNLMVENLSLSKINFYPKMSRDGRALTCLGDTIQRFIYVSDKNKFGQVEMWEDMVYPKGHEFEGMGILETWKADCESAALYLGVYLLMNGINPMQVDYVCGLVKGPDGKEYGHCWIEYMTDSSFTKMGLGTWYTLDWCFYPDARPFDLRQPKSERYLKEWFRVSFMELI